MPKEYSSYFNSETAKTILRHVNIQGNFCFRAKDQPSSAIGQHCTRMLLRLSEDYTWETVLCDQHSASIAVCEYKHPFEHEQNVTRGEKII